MGISSDRPAFVFVHGAWHNGTTWVEVVEELERRGYASIANDLPGAGANASNPASFAARPLDAEAFAVEPSPNQVTQDDRNQAVIADVRQAATMGNGRVVLVGHSLGGRTISPVTEAVPDDVGAVVYPYGPARTRRPAPAIQDAEPGDAIAVRRRLPPDPGIPHGRRHRRPGGVGDRSRGLLQRPGRRAGGRPQSNASITATNRLASSP